MLFYEGMHKSCMVNSGSYENASFSNFMHFYCTVLTKWINIVVFDPLINKIKFLIYKYLQPNARGVASLFM